MNEIRTAHCLFEQSGTFKNEFKKLGIEAYDYDILNDFGETDFVIDLYDEIRKAYVGGASIFDKINDIDIILAFFPCTRFEAQFNLWMIGKSFSQSSWDDKKKLEYALRMHTELSENYKLITMLSIICLNKRIPLIIENPYSKPHYLNQWWPIAPTWIDHDRTKRGDTATKPTQYWFFNMKPKHNFVLEPQEEIKSTWKVEKTHGTQRSMISKDYARKFIKEFIL